MRAAALVCLLLVGGLAGALAQAAAPAAAAGAAAARPSSKTFKAIGDFLGYKPDATDTVFVPTDAAWDAFIKKWGIERPRDLFNPHYTDLLTRVAAYHLHEKSAVKAAGMTNGMQMPMLDGNTITIVKSPTGQMEVRGAQNTAKIVATDLNDGGATVHLIDAVLIPKNVYPSLYDAIAARKDLSILKSYFDREPIARRKSSNPDFGGTYFATNDAGFRQLAAQDKVPLDSVLGTSAEQQAVSLMFPASAVPYGFDQLKALPAKQALPSVVRVAGVPERIFHEVNGSTVNVWGDLNLKDKATIVDKDILIGAGVMHVVDLPLLTDAAVSSKQTVMDVLKANPDLSHVAKMLAASGISDEMSTPTFFGTLFAPTNKAVEDFAAKMGFKSADDMMKIEPLCDSLLGYMLLPVAYNAERLKSYAPFAIAPFRGGKLRFSSAGGKVTVTGEQNSAAVVKADLDAGRAVVHVVDSVLMPENVFYTILDGLSYFPKTSIVQNLIKITPALDKAARDPKTAVTVFAPRNEAFTERSAGPTLIDGLEADAPTRYAGLSYHISPGPRFVPRDFTNGQSLKTLLAGQDLTVQLGSVKGADGKQQGRLSLKTTGGSDVDVVVINIIAGQSVVHGIDRLLVPKSFGPPAPAAVAGAGRR